jgi:hypothetical protein
MVEIDEFLHLPVEIVGAQRLAAQREGALDHRLGAVSDEMGEVVIGNGRKACLGNGVIEACDEIRCGIDQGSIKIKDNNGGGHEYLLGELRKDCCSGRGTGGKKQSPLSDKLRRPFASRPLFGLLFAVAAV